MMVSPAFSRPLHSFEKQMEAFNLPAKAPLCVAISGGADSMCLLHLLHDWCSKQHHPLIAVTVDHRIRSEAENEAKQVNAWCKQLGITHHILTWKGESPTRNIQAQAREIRYQLMHEFCSLQNIQHLFLAHHMQDQAETILIRLMRGAGVSGLSGIKAQSMQHDRQLLRPLLTFSKEDIINLLDHYQQTYINDPSNKNCQFLRVAIRQFLETMERKNEICTHIARSGHHLQRADNFIQQHVTQATREVVELHSHGFAILKALPFFQLHTEIALRILSTQLQYINGGTAIPRMEELENTYHQLHSKQPARFTLAGCFLQWGRKEKDKHLLYLIRETNALPTDQAALPRGIFDHRFAYQCDTSENLQEYYVGALGHQGWLNIQAKSPSSSAFPKETLYALPALKHLEKIISVPHIGFIAGGYDIHFSSSFLAENTDDSCDSLQQRL